MANGPVGGIELKLDHTVDHQMIAHRLESRGGDGVPDIMRPGDGRGWRGRATLDVNEDLALAGAISADAADGPAHGSDR